MNHMADARQYRAFTIVGAALAALIVVCALVAATPQVQAQDTQKTRYSFMNPIFVSETKVNTGGNKGEHIAIDNTAVTKSFPRRLA